MRALTHSCLRPFALLGLWLAVGVASASTLPDPVVEQGYPLRKVGAGELRWLGFPIYDASLWTSTGRYSGRGAGETVALSLWYQRSFSRAELLRITEIAWKKLGQPDVAQRERWLNVLLREWTDVAPGDNVTAVVTPDGPTRFYDQRGRFAQVDDPAFGPAFLAIWLDPRSVVSDLRLQLLGCGGASC
ncbi:MAG: chalcone isomerase family protein [Steroidobacteraceae bacterium]|nr:chalcone isomerase family protein [Steroidobacteraceae bacterium]